MSSSTTNAGGRHPWPDPIDRAGYYGLAGEFVRLIEPHSEADPVCFWRNSTWPSET